MTKSPHFQDTIYILLWNGNIWRVTGSLLEDPDVVNDALDLHSVVYREDSGVSSGVVFRKKSCLIGVNKMLETVEDQSPDVLSEKQTINVESSQASSSNFISAFKNRRKLKTIKLSKTVAQASDNDDEFKGFCVYNNKIAVFGYDGLKFADLSPEN